MPPRTQELTGIFLREKFRRDDWCIARVRITASADERFVVGREHDFLGESEEGELTPHNEFRFYGYPEENEYGGKSTWQFKFSTTTRPVPHTRDAVTRYLQGAPFIGSRIAIALWDKFQADAVHILRESPDVAAAACKLTPEQARAASDHLATLSALESTTMELMDLLAGHGLPKGTAKAAIKEWGNKAPERIKRDPYQLMRFRGCGFLRADKIYLALGLPPARIKRQAYCAWHALASDTEGHTWLPLFIASKGIQAHVGGVDVEPDKALSLAVRGKIVARRVDHSGREWAADHRKAAGEARLAEYVAAAMVEPSPWGAVIDSPKLALAQALAACTEHQRDNLLAALRGTVAILGGSPGTGKTFTAAALMRLIVETCGADSVAIAAPTGKAAVRCSEAMASYGLSLRARTIHSLLGVESPDDGSGAWGFKHKETNPLPYRFIVVDESSMIDVPLMASLLAARERGTGLLLIGDVNQLPPVGHGAPLRDLIAAGLPYGELREIKRNAGTIVHACAAIRDGRTFPVDTPEQIDLTADSPRNLVLAPAGSPQAAIDKIIGLIREIREAGEFDPTWDTQVVVAVNKKSALAREPLNKLLQAELNPTGRGCDGSPFKVDDKVIQLKNQFYRLADEDDKASEEQVFVANGEFGRVAVVEPKKTIAVFPSGDQPRRVVIPRGKQEGEGGSESDAPSTGCNLDLGYAATCHKMQGSQAPVVIVVLDEYPGASGRFGVAKREWIYTAASRAEKLCYLVGKMSTARKIMVEQALPNRKTFLAELLQESRLWGEQPWAMDMGRGPATDFPSFDAPSPALALEAVAHGTC